MPVLLKLAWRNLGRGWRRSAVVLSAISIGLSACVLLLAWSNGLMRQMAENAIQTELAHVAVHARGYHANPDIQNTLPQSGRPVVALVREHAGAHASPRLRGDGLVRSSRQNVRARIVGVEPRAEARVSVVADALVAGVFFDREQGGVRPSRLAPVVIGQRMADRLKVGLGKKVVLHVPGESGLGAFRVRGIFRTGLAEFDRSVAYLRLADAQRLMEVGDRVTEVAISLDRPEGAPALQAWLRQHLATAEEPEPVEVLLWQEREPRLAAMLDVTRDIAWIFYGAIFVAMAFGIANALLMAVYERIREFGVLRSLGLRPNRLVILVALESLILTLAGTALGLIVALPVVAWLSRTGVDMSAFSSALQEYGIGTTVYFHVEARDIVAPVLLSLVTAVLAALWPAFKAVRVRPAEAMRRV